MITILGLDADDTLWQNEEFFRLTQSEFANRLAPYMGDDPLQRHLIEVERRNIERYGYGIKGFMLSMIETAIEVSDGQIPTQIIQEILTLGHDMLDHPINLLPGVAQALPNLAENYRVILITKGDLLHQEQKIARSGLAPYFDQVEIVSEKDVATYAGIFGNDVAQSVMVGNSMKSDILPALEAGAAAVHIPAQFEWDLEKADVDW
ncbi:MAG: HAD family hydrolase, partial [Planktomarina sp.]